MTSLKRPLTDGLVTDNKKRELSVDYTRVLILLILFTVPKFNGC